MGCRNLPDAELLLPFWKPDRWCIPRRQRSGLAIFTIPRPAHERLRPRDFLPQWKRPEPAGTGAPRSRGPSKPTGQRAGGGPQAWQHASPAVWLPSTLGGNRGVTSRAQQLAFAVSGRDLGHTQVRLLAFQRVDGALSWRFTSSRNFRSRKFTVHLKSPTVRTEQGEYGQKSMTAVISVVSAPPGAVFLLQHTGLRRDSFID